MKMNSDNFGRLATRTHDMWFGEKYVWSQAADYIVPIERARYLTICQAQCVALATFT